jgi:hypothetical protein
MHQLVSAKRENRRRRGRAAHLPAGSSERELREGLPDGVPAVPDGGGGEAEGLASRGASRLEMLGELTSPAIARREKELPSLGVGAWLWWARPLLKLSGPGLWLKRGLVLWVGAGAAPRPAARGANQVAPREPMLTLEDEGEGEGED